MKKLLLILLISFYNILCVAQNPPVLRQFYFNPYLFNSAYAGISGRTEIYLIHRQQWLNVNDAPVTTGFNIQYPTQKRVSFGFNFLTQDVVALRNSTALVTFAYGIPISQNQSLRFGISGGIGLNSLSLEDGVDYSNDQTILTASANKIYADGNFGAVYSLGGLKIGFALPKLFGQKAVSPQEFDGYRFTQLKNQLYSISYKFDVVPGSISLEPYFLYHQNRDKQNSWEAASIIYFKDKIWTGASYNNTNGIAFFLGLSVKDKFRFGYSYELPPTNSNFVSTTSHEFHLNLRLGKKKDSKTAAKSKTTPSESYTRADSVKNEKPVDKNIEEVKEPQERVADQSNNQAKPLEAAVVAEEQIIPVAVDTKDTKEPTTEPVKAGKPPHSFELTKGYYLVVGAFRVMQNATNYLLTLKGKGYEDVSLAINGENNMYYVYIFSSYEIEEVRKARNQYRLRKPFSEAWIFSKE